MFRLYVGIRELVVYVQVQTSEKVCAKGKIPSLGFADTAEEVFKQGPKCLRKWSGCAR